MLRVEVALEARDEPYAVLRNRLRRLVEVSCVRLGLVAVIVAGLAAATATPVAPGILRQNVLREGGRDMFAYENAHRGSIINPRGPLSFLFITP